MCHRVIVLPIEAPLWVGSPICVDSLTKGLVKCSTFFCFTCFFSNGGKFVPFLSAWNLICCYVKVCSSKKSSREVGLYLGTGLLGSAVDFAVFALALWTGFPPILAQWIGASAGAVHNSLLQHYIVFTHTKKLRHTVLPNTMLSLATIIVSGPILVLFVQVTGSVWAGKVIILVCTAVLTYVIRKFLIFK